MKKKNKIEKIPELPVYSLNEWLSMFNGQRVLDNIIRQWYFRTDRSNPKKTKESWDLIVNKFHNETEI